MVAAAKTRGHRRPGARYLPVLLAVLAFGTLASQLSVGATLPDSAAWGEVAAHITANARPGDAVLVVPSWAERARLYFDDSLPVLALPTDDADLADPTRLWVIALPYAPGVSVKREMRTLADRFGLPEHRSHHRELALLRFDRPPRAWRYRFWDRLADAEVTLGGRPCPWRESPHQSPRFQCPRAGWTFVGAQVREIDYLPRECIWAHPTRGQPLDILFPAATLGEALEVRAGIIGEYALSADAGPVNIEVEVDGVRVGEVVVPPAPGFPRTRLDTPGAPATGAVRFRVTAENDGWRHLCFDARVPEPEGER